MEKNSLDYYNTIVQSLQYAKIYDRIRMNGNVEEIAKENAKLEIAIVASILIVSLLIPVIGGLFFGFTSILSYFVSFIVSFVVGIVLFRKKLDHPSVSGMAFLHTRIVDPANDFSVQFKRTDRLRLFVRNNNEVSIEFATLAQPLDVRQIDFIVCNRVSGALYADSFLRLVVFVLSMKNSDGYFIEVMDAYKFSAKYVSEDPLDGNLTVEIDMSPNKFDIYFPKEFKGKEGLFKELKSLQSWLSSTVPTEIAKEVPAEAPAEV